MSEVETYTLLERKPRVRREYNSWSGARYRCNNKKYYQYHLYGGRGITLSKEDE